MSVSGSKETRLVGLIRAFTDVFGSESFVLVDHWDSDGCAVGLARRDARRQLVYVSVWRTTTNRLFVGFETRATQGSLFADAEVAPTREVTFEHAVELAGAHLGLPVQRRDVRWERV